jgi:hypothetical protein
VYWIAKAYTLANDVTDQRYRGVLTGLMLQCGRDIPSFPDARFVKEIFSGLYSGMGVQDLMVALWVWKAEVEWVGAADPAEIDEDFARLLCPALLVRSAARQIWYTLGEP